MVSVAVIVSVLSVALIVNVVNVAIIMGVNMTVVVKLNMRISNSNLYENRANQLMQLLMAVCCATQLVASTVVCSSDVAVQKLFKSRGMWTVYITENSRLERAQCIMWLTKLSLLKI